MAGRVAGERAHGGAGAAAGPVGAGAPGAVRSGRGIPAALEMLLDYDVIEAFCVAGLRGPRILHPGHLPVGAVPAGHAGARRAGAAGDAVCGGRRRPRTRRPSGPSWPRSPPPSATRPSAVGAGHGGVRHRRRGCGPGSWRRCAAATSPAAAARWSVRVTGGPAAAGARRLALCRAGGRTGALARVTGSCSGPARRPGL